MKRRRAVALLLLAAISGWAACGKKPAKEDPRDVASAPEVTPRTGEEIYQQYCSVCHMADGSGVPNFQPALRGNAIVAGDPARLELVIRAGSAALMDQESNYAAPMPPFGTLPDEEIQAIVAYVRERFGSQEVGTTP